MADRQAGPDPASAHRIPAAPAVPLSLVPQAASPGLPPRPFGRNSAATIKRIIASAEIEFGTRGLDGTRIDDIARSAGISKQLIYHYFNGKEDLYSELLVHMARRSMEAVCAIDFAALEPLEAARRFFETVFRTYRDNPHASTITFDQGLHGGAQVRQHPDVERMRSDFYHRFGDAIRRGQAAGELRMDLDVAAVHFLAVVLVTGSKTLMPMFARYTGRLGDVDPGDDATCAQFSDYFMRSVST